MNANEMADDLDKFGQLFKDVAAMLRYQESEIQVLKQKYKQEFEYVEKLLKEKELWMICIFIYQVSKLLFIP